MHPSAFLCRPFDRNRRSDRAPSFDPGNRKSVKTIASKSAGLSASVALQMDQSVLVKCVRRIQGHAVTLRDFLVIGNFRLGNRRGGKC